MVYDEIEDFGRRIGLSALDLGNGPVTLDIEEIGRLTLTLKNDPGQEASQGKSSRAVKQTTEGQILLTHAFPPL